MGAIDRKTVLENLAQNIRLLEDPPPDVIPSSQNVIMAMRDAEELLQQDECYEHDEKMQEARKQILELEAKLASISAVRPLGGGPTKDELRAIIQKTYDHGVKLGGIIKKPAHTLSWDAVITLPPDQDVWIQSGRHELVKDRVSYDPKEDKLHQEYQMAIFTKASVAYGKGWIIWDRMPTQEQFEVVFELKEENRDEDQAGQGSV